MKIIDPDKINSFISEVHDLWFDIEQMQNSFADDRIELRLAKNSSALEKGSFEKILKIFHVTDIDVNDTEKVGYYDINKIIFDKKEKIMDILTGIPISIKIKVKNFELEIV